MTFIAELKNWALALCTAAICGAVMNMLLPEGSEKRIFKTVLCVFLLCSMLSPLMSLNFSGIEESLYIDEHENGDITEDLLALSAKQTEKALEDKAKAVLKEKDIDFDNIFAQVNISEDGSINISRFVITADEADAEKIRSTVYEHTGLLPEIEYKGENDNGYG